VQLSNQMVAGGKPLPAYPKASGTIDLGWHIHSLGRWELWGLMRSAAFTPS
jgi:hypothetical protein